MNEGRKDGIKEGKRRKTVYYLKSIHAGTEERKMKRTDGQSEEWREVHPCRVRGREGESEEEVKEEALCWGISSVRIPLSSRRVIDTSAASGGPEGKQPHPILLPPTLSLSIHPSIHPSFQLLIPPFVPSTVFSPQRAPQRPAPGPTVMERGRQHHEHQGGGGGEVGGGEGGGGRGKRVRGSGTVRDCSVKPRLRVQIPPFTNQNLSQDIFLFIYFFFFYQNHDIWKV